MLSVRVYIYVILRYTGYCIDSRMCIYQPMRGFFTMLEFISKVIHHNRTRVKCAAWSSKA